MIDIGTRGFLGFVIDGQEKVAYNHNDSYPEGLGLAVLSWLRTAASDGTGIAEQARALRVVAPGDTPSAEDIERLEGVADLRVGRQTTDDWYVLLRHTQGNPGAMLQAGVIEDAAGFPVDSLMCEWGYLVDLDAGRLEAYQGLQAARHSRGRYAEHSPRSYASGIPQYYPVALVASWPLDALPSNEAFVTALEPEVPGDAA